MESFLTILRGWNKSTTDREKLQHVYLCLIIVVTIGAGLLALLDAHRGRQLITVAGIAIVAFLANALVWALTRVYIVDRLGANSRRSAKK